MDEADAEQIRKAFEEDWDVVVCPASTAPRRRGGVAIFTRPWLRARSGERHSTSEAQWVHVALPGGHVYCGYISPSATPGKRRDFEDTLAQDIAAKGRGAAVIVAGDWNITPGESERQGCWMGSPLRIQAPRAADGAEEPTRIDGARCIG